MTDNDLKMVISRGKVTFSRTTATRCSTWVLSAGDSPDKILDVMEDIILELRYPNGFGTGGEEVDYSYELDAPWRKPEDEVPVSDGVAFQPPKTAVIGGEVFLGHSEPTPR